MSEDYEGFSPEQLKILENYVTHTISNVFAIRNLPEVIKGALFSRYSRSSLGFRSLLLKEFIQNEETSFAPIVGNTPHDDEQEGQTAAIQKAQRFYDRILDGYGDDSIGELGGSHLCVENVSMLLAKGIENCRIGGSPLEKSTRYIYFDQKRAGEFLFYKEPILMASAFRETYIQTCNQLFETYSALIPPLTEFMEKKFPREHDTSKIAYTASLRAKVLDCLRGLLPASALTNMGVYGNGRFFEALVQKLGASPLAEMQDVGKKAFKELSKVIPSFIRRGDPSHKHQKAFHSFHSQMKSDLNALAKTHATSLPRMDLPGLHLIEYNPDSPYQVAAALLFEHSHAELKELIRHCRALPEEELSRILDAACNHRENRRHKSPRALEHATFTFELLADFGVYRDLQRHRILTQRRQLLTCEFGYFIPQEILDTSLEKPYRDAMDLAKDAYEQISAEFPEEAQYVVPMAYNTHWYFHVNLRSLQWLCELRSMPAGHPNYRYLAQEMAAQVGAAIPAFERFFKFVDRDGHALGRLGQEVRIVKKRRNETTHV